MDENSFSEKIIKFNPIYAKVTGSTDAALLLSAILQWSKLPNEWVVKTQKEIEEEICLSRHQQETSRKKLIQFGILETKRQGLPSKTFYKINIKKLEEKIHEFKNGKKS